MRIREWLPKVVLPALVISACGGGLAVAGGGPSDSLAAGKFIYMRSCSPCHGADGKGDGVAAPNLDPRPRNFTTGLFKFRSTPSGSPPTDADLARTITHGLHSTAMGPWAEFSDQDTKDVIVYVKGFSDAFKGAAPTSITIPPQPAFSQQAIEQGRHWFTELGCVKCHGDQGHGDGPSAADLKDAWGFPIRPANLARADTLKRGDTSRDIYTDVFTGLSGTPMPSFAGILDKSEDEWNLVYYVYWLSRGGSFEEAARDLRAETEPSSVPPTESVPY